MIQIGYDSSYEIISFYFFLFRRAHFKWLSIERAFIGCKHNLTYDTMNLNSTKKLAIILKSK